MSGLILVGVFLGALIPTSYRSVPKQTKPKDCEYTSIGDHVCHDGVAVSQDLLLSGRVKYGDWLYLEGIGLKRVNDTMNARHKNRVDVWVNTYKEEKEFEARYKQHPIKVWIIHIQRGE